MYKCMWRCVCPSEAAAVLGFVVHRRPPAAMVNVVKVYIARQKSFGPSAAFYIRMLTLVRLQRDASNHQKRILDDTVV